MIGRTLGKYRFIEKIGRGGMGTVYRAVDETLDREVAIKAISPELVEDDLVRRFRIEAQTLAKVNHPNIATVHELFREDDQLLMVMELVSGQSFDQLLERSGPLPVERAAALAAQVLDALSHAHRAGIVHRDLKPANLMLSDSGIVKVMDFGIARVVGTERMTSDGLMVGTPAYMAPEQVRGDEVDGRTDLYALGVVFYRMLTGKLPFKADTAVAMIQSQLNVAPTPARQLRPDLPEWLDAVLTRALAKGPEDRFQSAEEFRQALEPIASALDDLTVAPGSASRGPVASPASAVTPVSTGAHGTTTLVLNRSHLAVAGALGLLFVLAIGLLAWLSLRRPVLPAQTVSAPATAVPPPVTGPAQTASVPAPAAASALAQPNAAPPPKPAALSPEGTTASPERGAVPPVAGTSVGQRGPGPGGSGRSGGAAPLRTPDGGFQPMVVRDARAIVSLEGRGSRMVETILTFSERSITATDNDGATVKSFPYDAVTHATFSRSRSPRGAGGVDIQVPGGIPQGNVFARGVHPWITIETADDRLVLRLEPTGVRPVIEFLQRRTKASLESYEDPEKP